MLQKKLFKDGIDDADRFNDLKALWKDLDTPAKKQSLNDSLEAYKAAAQSDPNAKFWMKDSDSVQQTGYRYVTQELRDQIVANNNVLSAHTGNGWYCSFDEYSSAFNAKQKLQLIGDESIYKYRIEFQVSQVKNNMRVARGLHEDPGVDFFEFICRDYDGVYGTGRGTQFLVDGTDISITAIVPLQ